MNKLCTICMRKGSKGVKNKNIRKINGKYLMQYTIDQAVKSNLFDAIVVSTDCKKILNISKKLGIENGFIRQKKLGNDTIGKLDVIKDALEKAEAIYSKKFDIIFDLDITSPLRKVKDIRDAYDIFIKNKYNNLFSVCSSKKNPYFNQVEYKNKKITLSKKVKNNIKRRQDAPKVYDMNASIYIWRRDTLLFSKSLFSDGAGIFEMPEERSIDIDSEHDLQVVKFLMK